MEINFYLKSVKKSFGKNKEVVILYIVFAVIKLVRT